MARGARAVLQVYPENLAQRELILGFAMRAGFSGGVVVDFPHRYVKDITVAFIYLLASLFFLKDKKIKTLSIRENAYKYLLEIHLLDNSFKFAA